MRGPDMPTGGRRRASQFSMPTQARARAGSPHIGGPERFSLANWSVSTRLAALCAMASVLGLVFGGLRISDTVGTSNAYAHTVQLAIVGSKVTKLAQALEDERDIFTGVTALTMLQADTESPGAAPVGSTVLDALNGRLTTEQAELSTAEGATDRAARSAAAAIEGIDSAGAGFPASIQAKAAVALKQIAYITNPNGFPAGLRVTVKQLQSGIPPEMPIDLIGSYSGVLRLLFALDDEITTGSGDVELGYDVRSLSALSESEDQASQQRAILYGALIDSSLSDAGTGKGSNNVGGPTALSNFGGLDAFITAQDLQSDYQQAFEAVAAPALTAALLTNNAGSTQGAAALIEGLVTTGGDPTVIFPMGQAKMSIGFTLPSEAPAGWYFDMSATIDGMRSIDNQLVGVIVARSQLLQHQAFESAVITALATVLAVLLVLLAAAFVARSMVNPLRRLQRDALEIATVKLPERVAAAASGNDLSEEDQAGFDHVEPIGVQSTDEIGAVARAFDQVHAEAVRLAGTEAQLRSNLNAMFISLSRRSVPLIDRLSRMIDNFEQNENDPDQLSHLFSMDHLVTRMRRNSENLLVLAGEEPVRKWSEPVPLTDVARAAAAEIEQYGRVALTVQPGIMVSGQATADVVHLLAELLENATLFSPRDTQVQAIAADAPGGGVLIEIRDVGVGVSTGRLAEMNWRLDHPPGVDVSVSRHMGLFAVSRLAARRGIRVRLRAGAPQGLTALVWLPGTLTSREQPPAVGMHSRPHLDSGTHPAELAFADSSALPDGPAELAQRTYGRQGGQGGRHRLSLLASAQAEAANERSSAGRQQAIAGGQQQGTTGGYQQQQAVAGGQPQQATTGGQPQQRSVWFAAKKPSSASGQTQADADADAGAGAGAPASAGNGVGQADADWGAARPLSAGAHYAGTYSAELAARAGDGEGGEPPQVAHTRAGLPLRVPQAISGSTGQPAGNDSAADDVSALGTPPGTGAQTASHAFSATGAQRQVSQQMPLRRRSPEAARNRLAGFQLGSHDAAQAAAQAAAKPTVQPGNGQSGNGQPGNGQPGNGQPGNGQPGNGQGWAAFSRGDETPYPPPQSR
jgi:HAMP domain-containing protein